MTEATLQRRAVSLPKEPEEQVFRKLTYQQLHNAIAATMCSVCSTRTASDSSICATIVRYANRSTSEKPAGIDLCIMAICELYYAAVT